MSKDERDIFERYIKPQLGALKRLKFRIWALTRSKKIRTLKDVEFLDYNLMIKLMCFMMLIACIRLLITYLYEVYVWFYPGAIFEDPTYPFYIPMVRRIMEGVINV